MTSMQLADKLAHSDEKPANLQIRNGLENRRTQR
jgi:hypothetical protein